MAGAYKPVAAWAKRNEGSATVPAANWILGTAVLPPKTASSESRSALIFVPQVSSEAPTSGFVRLRLVVKVSAMRRSYCGQLSATEVPSEDRTSAPSACESAAEIAVPLNPVATMVS